MKRIHIHLRPTKIADLKFDDWYDEISHDWQHRAEQLQLRRWRQLKHQIKAGH